MVPTPLNSRRIAAALAGQPIGHDVQVFPTLPSTSDHLRELGMAGYPHGMVVFAEQQTQGRGRRDHRWESEEGVDLMFSMLLRPQVGMEFWPRLTSIAALAICRAIEACDPSLSPLVKWPNDIYFDGRKTAGILAETFSSSQGPFMVLGIGLNVNRSFFPDEIADIATSLKLVSGREQPREQLAILLLREINQLTAHWEHGYARIIDGLRERSALIGGDIRASVDQREVIGRAVDLNEEGHLVIVLADGSRLALSSAEQVRALA